MEDKELILRLNDFFTIHMKAFVNYPTDIGELNELLMELERRVRLYKREESNNGI